MEEKEVGLVSKLIIYSLLIAISFQPIYGRTEVNSTSMESAGRDAQILANDIVSSFRTNPGEVSNNGEISYPTLENGKFKDTSETVNIKDLFPGTSGSSITDYFPDGSPPATLSELETIYNSDEGMNEIGGNAKGVLWADANSNNPTISGAAYKIVLDATNRSRPDFTNDPILNLSKATYENIDMISEGFGDCSVEKKFNQYNKLVHREKIERCTRVPNKSNTCEIKDRRIDVSTEQYRAFSYTGNVDHVLELHVMVATPTRVSWSGSGRRGALESGVRNVGGYYKEVIETGHGDLSGNIVYSPIPSYKLSADFRMGLAQIEVMPRWEGTIQSLQITQQPSVVA